MATYRIKSQKEFEDEIHIPTYNWRREFPKRYKWKSPEMDKLHGIEFTEEGFKILLEHKRFNDEDVLDDMFFHEHILTKSIDFEYLNGWMYHESYFKRIES